MVSLKLRVHQPVGDVTVATSVFCTTLSRELNYEKLSIKTFDRTFPNLSSSTHTSELQFSCLMETMSAAGTCEQSKSREA